MIRIPAPLPLEPVHLSTASEPDYKSHVEGHVPALTPDQLAAVTALVGIVAEGDTIYTARRQAIDAAEDWEQRRRAAAAYALARFGDGRQEVVVQYNGTIVRISDRGIAVVPIDAATA